MIGQARGLSRTLTEEVRRVLEDTDAVPEGLLTKRSRKRVEALRVDRAYTLDNTPIRLAAG
jgi:hypothetical protein